MAGGIIFERYQGPKQKTVPGTAVIMTTELESVWRLISEAGEVALGTLEGETPFVSATAYLFEREDETRFGNFYLLLSDRARHTENLKIHNAVSLLVVGGDPAASPIHERPRVTILGRAEPVQSREKSAELRERYLEIFPRSKIFLTLPDFRFYGVRPREIHWIGGFGEARSWTIA